MKTLYFDNITDLCCTVSNKYDSLTDEFADVSVIAKYNEAKEIIKELLCIGHQVADIDIQRESFDNYYDEYIISLDSDGVWCEKFKRENGYLNDESVITFISNECNSACISHVRSNIVYAFEIDGAENDCSDCDISAKNITEYDTDGGYHVTVKCNLDADEALKILDNMEKRIDRMNDTFAEMDRFRRLFQ